jgi:hypothetical protein
MMSEGDLITFETTGQLKKFFPSLPGTEKTGILPVLRTVGSLSDVCEFDMVGETFFFKIILQDFGPPRIESQIDMNCDQFIMDRDPL